MVTLIGVAVGVGYLLTGSDELLYTKSVDVNKRHYFIIYIRDSDYRIDQPLTSSHGNSVRPNWSPDGQQIAYIGSNADGFHVYIADAVGRNIRQAAYVFISPDSSPIWSPDGKWILLSVSQMAAGETILLHIETGEVYALPQYVGAGNWSLDSQVVFYQAASENGAAHLYGMNINCLAHVDSCQFDELDFLSGQTVYSVPEWSPDKQRVAFYAISESTNKIVVMQLRCTELTASCIQHSTTIADRAPNYSNPIWSPDGKQLAFVEGHYALTIYEVATGAIRSFDIPSIYPFLNNWSSDGKFIAYHSEAGGMGNMYLLNLITGESRPLHRFLTSEFPEWRPVPH